MDINHPSSPPTSINPQFLMTVSAHRIQLNLQFRCKHEGNERGLSNQLITIETMEGLKLNFNYKCENLTT